MSVMEIVIKGVDKASDVMEDVQKKGSKAADTIAANWKKIGVAAGVAGLAIEGMARSQAQLTEQTQQLAAMTDMTEGEMRDLAISISDVTRPLEDTLNLMELASQQGIKGTEALEKYAVFWDTVGDATGESSAELAKAGNALRLVGIEVGNEEEALASFGYITDNTTSSVSEFLNFVQRSGVDLKKAGLSLDETTAIFGALNHEMGLESTMAMREFREALNAADGDMNVMLETLGLSNDQVLKYMGQVDDSSDAIQRNADIHAESYTTMEKLQHRVSEIAYKYGDLSQAMSILVPFLLVAAPAIKALTLVKGAWAAASAMGASGVWALVSAQLALIAPIALVVAAIAVVVLVLKKLYNENEQFRAIVDKTWSFIQEKVGAVLTVVTGLLVTAFEYIYTIVEAGFTKIMEFWAVWGDEITLVVTNIFTILSAIFSTYIDLMVGAFKFMTAILKGDWSDAWDIIANAFDIAMDGINTAMDIGWTAAKDLVLGIWDDLIVGVQGKIDAIWKKVQDLVDRIKNVDLTPGGGGGGGSMVADNGGRTIVAGRGRAPKFHTGGTFKTQNPGGEGLALLRDGERILPSGQNQGRVDGNAIAALAQAIAGLVKPNISLETNISGADMSPMAVSKQQQKLLRKLAMEWEMV